MSDKYLVLISSYIPFGSRRVNLLISYFGSPKKVWESSKLELLSVGLSESVVDQFISYRNSIQEKDYFQKLKKMGINYVSYGDKVFPDNLMGLDDSPNVLYYKGVFSSKDINAVAIVGSRQATNYGIKVAKYLSSKLSKCGIPIVSGLAFGIDYVAHKAALDSGGRCIAVLASGVDQITPRTNEGLGKKIISSSGLILSEYPPHTKPEKYYFPYRNRIISGLSKAVVVIEGRIKSGTIHTANAAASQGRQVFAVPGSITSPNSEAPNYLIQNGARLVMSVQDILDEIK